MDGEAWKSIGSQSVRHSGSDGSIENFCTTDLQTAQPTGGRLEEVRKQKAQRG